MSLLFALARALTPAAEAGYGDARDGLPTHADRETFFWTNAVRVDPAAFQDAYPCAFGSFSAGERTPKAPLRFNSDLTEAAEYHSSDMDQDGYFDHDSNDGTRWNVRIGRYYQGSTIAENIAYGYRSPYEAVVEGWMCSGGHRANIMSGSYNEMGAGVSGTYYTQDFGFRSSAPDRAMSIGVHLPESPSGDVTFYVDWDGPVPDRLQVVVDGVPTDLDLVIGDPTQGVYGVELRAGGGCQPYYFSAEVGGRTETFPEDGSYGFGSCSWDDAPARWLDAQVPLPQDDPPDDETDPETTDDPPDDPDPTDDDTDDDDAIPLDPDATAPTGTVPTGCACASGALPAAPSGVAGLGALAATAVFVRRRRRG
jgi:MYXO-CTERM domain-containing protein